MLIDKDYLARLTLRRLNKIKKMRAKGMTLKAIGIELAISKQRVSQILKASDK